MPLTYPVAIHPPLLEPTYPMSQTFHTLPLQRNQTGPKRISSACAYIILPCWWNSTHLRSRRFWVKHTVLFYSSARLEAPLIPCPLLFSFAIDASVIPESLQDADVAMRCREGRRSEGRAQRVAGPPHPRSASSAVAEPLCPPRVGESAFGAA